MILSLLLLVLVFALISQAAISWFIRRSPQEASVIRMIGLSCSLPILGSALLIALIIHGHGFPDSEMSSFAWRASSLIYFATMLGVLVSGDAGRWSRVSDDSIPGVKRFRVPGFGGLRRPLIMRPLLLAPVPQSRRVRRARQIMGFIAILFALNAGSLLSEHAQGRRPSLKSTPIIFAPSALSTIVVEILSGPDRPVPGSFPASTHNHDSGVLI